MSRVFITGSTDGLGLMAARLLLEEGHQVVLHARDTPRAADVRRSLPSAEAVAVGDLSSIAETRAVAEQVNHLGRLDAVIHNAGVGYREPRRIQTKDDLPHVFAINVLAPYILTALIDRPKRLVYLSSGMHRGANSSLDDINGSSGAGKELKPTPKPNYTTCFWRLPWRGAGPTFYRTRWSLAGCRPRWAAVAPRTIWTRLIELRCGLPSAMIPGRWCRDSISITSVSGQPIPPCTTQRARSSCSTSADGSQV